MPGLNGWALDATASDAATKRAGDGRLHLAWKAVAPATTLASLPREPIYRGPTAERYVSLLVNVSWGEQYLTSMLHTLTREHVHATFFLDGRWVQKNPDAARSIQAAGQAIGSHGSGHPDFRRLSTGQIERQMRTTDTIIRSLLGQGPVAFAPPSGAFNPRTVAIAHRFGLHTILWTVDTIDWRRPSAAVIVQRVDTQMTPGGFVLMHPTESTATALPTLIAHLKARGYQFRTIADVVSERRVQPPTVVP